MPKSPTWLAEHKSDVYSQSGEDGVIGQILMLLPERDQWCVEFGAWDGQHLSNSRNLIENQGYSAVLIEGDQERFQELQANYARQENVAAVNRFVGFEGPDTLDRILEQTPIPLAFDFLCVDIDGNDYHVWDAMSKYQPKVVCIEFNPTIPNEVDFVQAKDLCVSQGSALSSLVRLGREKGYELVSSLQVNAFFVRSEYFALFEIEDNRPETLRTDMEVMTYLFSGYDGSIFLRGHQQLPWHGIALRESRFQYLPSFLRRHPYNYGRLGRAAVKLYRRASRGFRKRVA